MPLPSEPFHQLQDCWLKKKKSKQNTRYLLIFVFSFCNKCIYSFKNFSHCIYFVCVCRHAPKPWLEREGQETTFFFFFFQKTIFEKVSSLCPPRGSQGRDSGSQSFMLGGQHLYTLRHLCGLKAIMFTCVWAGWVFSSTFLMSELHFHSLVSSSLCFITADFSFGVFLLARTHSFVCVLRPYGAYFHFQTLYWFHFKSTCSSFPLCSVVSLCFHIFLNLSLLTLHAVHFRVFRVLILWRVLCGYSFSWS